MSVLFIVIIISMPDYR